MKEYVKNLEERLADADKQIEDLKHKSVRDELTGAYNRNYYENNKVKLISEALEEKQTLGMYIFDLNGLKYVNDNFGHEKGDKILKDFVKILNSTFRKNAEIIRLGGDEFGVIDRKVSDKTEIKTIGRLNENIALYNKHSNKDINYQLSCSEGYTEVDLSKKNAFESAFGIADDKMYKQKYVFRLRNLLVNHINKINYSKINK